MPSQIASRPTATIAVISSRPSAGNCESIMPALGRKPRDNRPRCFRQSEGRRDELAEAIGPSSPLEAGRRGQGRLEGEDPPRGPDRSRQRQAGVAAVGTDVEPRLARAAALASSQSVSFRSV